MTSCWIEPWRRRNNEERWFKALTLPSYRYNIPHRSYFQWSEHTHGAPDGYEWTYCCWAHIFCRHASDNPFRKSSYTEQSRMRWPGCLTIATVIYCQPVFFFCGACWDGKGQTSGLKPAFAIRFHSFWPNNITYSFWKSPGWHCTHICFNAKHINMFFFPDEKLLQVYIWVLSWHSTPTPAFDHTTTMPCWCLELPLLQSIYSPMLSSVIISSPCRILTSMN